MGNLNLSVAIGDYDRTRAIIDNIVKIDGVDPVIMPLEPEEIFYRGFRNAEFDICELSLSSFVVKTAAGNCPYVGVPVFLSRAFRHTSIYVRSGSGIEKPEDLKGRRVGVPEYQLTACVWARSLLEDHGVYARDVTWIRGGIEEPGRPEKIAINLPPDIVVEEAPAGRSLSAMLEAGEIDALVTPRAPTCYRNGNGNVQWLFSDTIAAAREYFTRTGIFPIMHLVGIRRELADKHPWLPAAVLKAFNQSKAIAMEKLGDTSATKVTLPFVEEQLKAAREMMGHDFWSYGVKENSHVLEAFLDLHHHQGLSARRLSVAELFHPAVLETHKI